MSKLDKTLRVISKAYNLPYEWVKDAYFGGLQSINDIIEYCEARKEMKEIEEKKNEAK